MNEIIIGIIGIIGGSTGQYFLSTFFLSKKDERSSDQEFIDTLIQRVYNLEGRTDELSKQLTTLMSENAVLRVELAHIQKENRELKKRV